MRFILIMISASMLLMPQSVTHAKDIADWTVEASKTLKKPLRTATKGKQVPTLFVTVTAPDGSTKGVQTAGAQLQDQLIAKLASDWKKKLRLVTRDSLGTAIAEQRRISTDFSFDFENMIKASEADLVLDLNFVAGGRSSLKVRGRLVDARTGTVVTTVKPGVIDFREPLDKPVPPFQTTRDLVRAMAADLEAVGLAEPIRLAGTFFASSRLQSGFGDRFVLLLSSGLGARAGLDVRQPTSTAPEGSAEYSVTYWVGDSTLLMVGQLRDAEGRDYAWEYGLTTKAAGPGIRPQAARLVVAETVYANPTRFTLTTNRGDRPVYSLKDVMQFELSLRYNSYVDCYYQQADQSVIKIFPNQFHPDNYLPSGSRQLLPSQQMPFEFTASPPVGSEYVACFASPQKLDSLLPITLRAPELGSDVGMTLGEIQALYDSRSGGKSEMASVVLNVIN